MAVGDRHVGCHDRLTDWLSCRGVPGPDRHVVAGQDRLAVGPVENSRKFRRVVDGAVQRLASGGVPELDFPASSGEKTAPSGLKPTSRMPDGCGGVASSRRPVAASQS